MTYAKPEQPVLRTPKRKPTPVPRANKKLCTRCAADSVSDIAIVLGKISVSVFYADLRSRHKTGLQRIFDHEQPSKFLHRYSKRFGPLGRRAQVKPG